jgi:nucleoid-associated protein YgaU
MNVSDFATSRLAEWFDRNKKESEKELEAFVDAYPNLWAVGAVVQTSMDLGAGMVDVLRFGEGFAESWETGAVWPLVQDLFRALAIAGPLGRGGSALARAGLPRLGRAIGLYADVAPKQGICAPIATANAIRRTGNSLNERFLLSLDDVARAHGKPGIAAFEGAAIDESIGALKALKVPHEVFRKAESWSNVERLARNNKGVVMVRLMRKDVVGGHRILIESTGDGIQIIDRTGIHSSLESVLSRYSGQWVLDPNAKAVLVKNGTVRTVNLQPALMAEVGALIPRLTGTSLEALDQQFQQFKAQQSQGRMGGGVPAGVALGHTKEIQVTVSKFDTLSGLAAKYYGELELWPLLWDINRGVVGGNPNRISPGMTLRLPPLADFTSAQIADARKRHPTWKNYGMRAAG